MSWTRRTLLFGAGSLVLATAVGGLVASAPTVHTRPQRPLRALDATRFSILVAVADTICPAGSGVPSCKDLGIAEDIDAFLATCDPAVADEVALALTFIENALPSLMLDGHPRGSFTAASPESRARVTAAFRDSGIGLRRTVYKALLGLVAATYFGHTALASHTGYQPVDWSGRL